MRNSWLRTQPVAACMLKTLGHQSRAGFPIHQTSTKIRGESMRFRETTLGRTIHRLPGGEHLLRFGRAVLTANRDLQSRRETLLDFKRNVREAYSRTGIEYTPLSGLWPLYLK